MNDPSFPVHRYRSVLIVYGTSERLINKEEFKRDIDTEKTKDITEICKLTEELT